jgi:hypothetical protein
MPRFSLRWLLTAMAFAGLVIAVLHRPEWYLTGTLALTVWASLVVAAMTVVLCGVRTRPFAFGFAFVGLTFLVTSVLPPAWNVLSNVRGGVNAISQALHEYVAPTLAQRFALPGDTVTRQGDAFVYGSGRSPYHFYLEYEHTETTVRLAFTMLLACTGGCAATVIQARERRIGSEAAS